MNAIRLPKIVSFSVVLALLTSIAAGLSVLDAHRITGAFISGGSTTWTMISRFVVVLVFGAFGLIVARASHLKGSLIVTSQEWQLSLRDFINFGVLPGVVLGIINYLCFFNYRYSSDVIPRIRDMKSFYDSFILSLDSGMAEEIVYRLFLFSCLLFTFRQLSVHYKSVRPRLAQALPMVLALVISSLLFALVHNFSAFTAAFFGGMLLGLIYLKSGIEGAIAAHFVANFLFFSAVYLA